MEPEPDPIDLSVLDPNPAGPRFDRAVARVAERALELRRFRRAVFRRGVVALALAAAAGLALWLSAPRPEPAAAASSDGILGWAIHDPGPDEVLGLGGGHAK